MNSAYYEMQNTQINRMYVCCIVDQQVIRYACVLLEFNLISFQTAWNSTLLYC